MKPIIACDDERTEHPTVTTKFVVGEKAAPENRVLTEDG